MTEKPKLAEAYPLYWPEGRPRTRDYERTWSRFKTSLAVARDSILREVKLLGGTDLILSTNIPLRRDGLPYADKTNQKDPGAAVYFHYKKQAMCFACDRWAKVEDNLHAIALTITALRGIARWGTGDMMAAAFRGFVAIEAPGAVKSWRAVLGIVPGETDVILIQNAYKRLRSQAHPDREGGSSEQFNEVQRAYDQALQELMG